MSTTSLSPHIPGGGLGQDIVGFTLNSTARNVGNNPIPWLFPVVETANNPWIQANISPPRFPSGFTGQEEDFNHMHNLPPQPNLPNTNHPQEVGQHPHIQFYLYRQPEKGKYTRLIGKSDLKHTYLFGPPPKHEALPRGQDSYNIFHNQDQSFYGPISEMNANTFRVAAHNHMGSPYAALGPGFHRDHGELNFAGGPLPGGGVMPADPGHPGADPDMDGIDDNIDHLLQARLIDLNPAQNPDARWFLAGTYFVVDDVNLANNSLWVEIFPAFDGMNFTFEFGTGDFDLDTIPKLPAPATLLLLGSGLAGSAGLAWRRQNQPRRAARALPHLVARVGTGG